MPGRLTEYASDGLVFDVRDAGPATGEPVVLLHGWPQDASSWDGVVACLHDAGLRTLAPDQRGYSPRARPAGRTAYRMSRLTADVLALLDAAGLPAAHVVGHDWGGAVAWALAARHPDRVRTVTVLSTPHPGALLAALATSRQALRNWYMAAFQLPWLPERLVAARLEPLLRRSGLPAEHARAYAARLGSGPALAPTLGWYRAIPFSAASPVGTVRVATTYLWGEDDVALGRRAAELTRRFVAADYLFQVLQAGHWLPETCPEEVAEAVVARVRGS